MVVLLFHYHARRIDGFIHLVNLSLQPSDLIFVVLLCCYDIGGKNVRKITIYHNTDYVNKGRSSLFRRKKTCRLNVVNFDTLN